jgi:hypothetical protein
MEEVEDKVAERMADKLKMKGVNVTFNHEV